MGENKKSDKRKASMVARQSDVPTAPRILGAVGDDGKLVPLDSESVEVGVPTPIVYADSDGVLHEAVYVIKEAEEDESKASTWWWKVMLTDLLELLEDISGKQTQALRAILDQFDPHSGIVVVTQKELAKQAGCSINTVNKVVGLMIKHNLIKMPQRGVYTINPEFMSQGGRDRFNAMLIEYRKTKNVRDKKLQKKVGEAPYRNIVELKVGEDGTATTDS